MLRAIIFDFDGVFRHWDEAETRAIEERFGLPRGTITAVAFEPALFDRAMTGRIPFETWLTAIRNAVSRAHGPEAAEAVTLWGERKGWIDPAMVDLARGLRGKVRTGLLSNASTRLEADLQAFKLDQTFDVVVSSARVGYMKPDPVIYRVAAVRLGFLPHECVYVDDTDANVTAARAFGMTAIDFHGVEALRERLGELGVLPDAAP
jgi:putative hydrolase of the HAD superfamily